MKRAVALLLSLTALGAAGLVYAHRVVSASAEAVEVSETVLYGDRTVAEGVEVHFPMESRMHLFWNTTLRVGAENETETSFRLSVHGDSKGHDWRPPQPLGLGVSDNIGGEILPEPEHELYALVSDVASRVSSGTSGGESVRLRDYYEYMPLYVRLEHEYRVSEGRKLTVYGYNEQLDSVLERRIRGLFAIPVPEDYYLNVSVEKGTAGDVLRWSVNPQQEEQVLQLDYATASAEEGRWLAAHLSGGDGQFTCEGTDKLWYIPADVANEIICVMELDPGEEVRSLETDALGRILALVCRDGEYYIRVADSGDTGYVQTLSLPNLEPEDWISRVYTGESFVLAKSVKGHFEMFELTEIGEYIPRLSGELCEPRENTVYGDSHIVVRWDGQRLVMAAPVFGSDSSKVRQGTGFMLWVFDDGGGSFCAQYDSSLGMTESLGYPIEWREGRPITLR